MTPFYERDGIVIFHGDCREVLAALPRELTSDAMVVDPPYGKGFKSNRGALGAVAGDLPEDQVMVLEGLKLGCKRLRRGRHVYIFGPLDLSGLPLCGPAELIWDKEKVGMGDLSSPWGPQHETITFATYETSKANREKRGYGKLAARLRKGSVLRCLRHNAASATKHPTEKPVDILRQMIESSTVIGERVLDPFMGSGSTLVAAALEGRTAVGIEVEARYCELAAQRVDQVLDVLSQLG